MTSTNKLMTVATVAALASSLSAFAAETPAIQSQNKSHQGDWANTLKTIGTVYKSDDGFINKLRFFGRYQWQSAYIDGTDVNNHDFSERFVTHRRFRLGAQLKFADYFELKSNVNIVSDGRYKNNDLDFGFPSKTGYIFDEAKFKFDAGKAFGAGYFDKLSFTYGRQKLKMSEEAHESSKNIKTVERSALSNKVFGSALPAGLTMDYAKGDWEGTFGIFSAKVSEDKVIDTILGEWDAGLGYYASLSRKFDNGDKFIFDVLYHDKDQAFTGDTWFSYEWATSLAYGSKIGDVGYIANVIVGDNGENSNANRKGLFYGIILTGNYWLAKDTLELVGQYQWQGSEESEGIRTNSRYFRASKNAASVNSGRGDSHHSIYAGLNWYICGENAKIMTGVEYQNLSTPSGDANSTTLHAAYRMYF